MHVYNCVKFNTAESQSILFQSILSKMELTTEEQTIVSRGRNAGSASGGRKRGPKRLYSSTKEDANGGPSVYQNSTAFEALIGYLYLTNVERCSEILEHVRHEMDMMDKDEGVVR
jgi:ribonuclease-3 family protein